MKIDKHVHIVCIYFYVCVGVSVLEVFLLFMNMDGWMVVGDSVYLDWSLYHFCKVV